MKRIRLLAIGFIACLAVGNAVAADTATEQISPSQQATEANQTGLLDRIVSPHDNFGVTNGFDPRYLQKVNNACGYPPYPLYGCKVGACVCDQNGGNCHWTFVCK